jgi:hypothetical protein
MTKVYAPLMLPASFEFARRSHSLQHDSWRAHQSSPGGGVLARMTRSVIRV